MFVIETCLSVAEQVAKFDGIYCKTVELVRLQERANRSNSNEVGLSTFWKIPVVQIEVVAIGE